MNGIKKMDTKKLSIRNTQGEISPLTTKYHQLYTPEERREEGGGKVSWFSEKRKPIRDYNHASHAPTPYAIRAAIVPSHKVCKPEARVEV